MLIYQAKRIVTNQCYIGSASSVRGVVLDWNRVLLQSCHDNDRLFQAVERFGVTAFKLSIIDERHEQDVDRLIASHVEDKGGVIGYNNRNVELADPRMLVSKDLTRYNRELRALTTYPQLRDPKGPIRLTRLCLLLVMACIVIWKL